MVFVALGAVERGFQYFGDSQAASLARKPVLKLVRTVVESAPDGRCHNTCTAAVVVRPEASTDCS